MSCLCDPYFIFSLIFIAINHIAWLKRIHLLFAHFLEYLKLVFDENMDVESE